VVVYGVVDTTDPLWLVTPEFYIAAKDFYLASEMVGQHELGTPITTTGQESAATKITTSKKLTARIDALSKIVIGLSYYSLHEWDKSLDLFQSAVAIPNWDESEGKEILYLLVGNAALKSGKLDTAETAFKKSLLLQAEYARAYIGLAATYSKRAMAIAEATTDLSKIDVPLLDSAIEIYKKAELAKLKPAQADIQAKVDFGIGQSIFRRALGRNDTTYNDAVKFFESVITAYSDKARPELQELVAHAHAHLAAIYSWRGYGPVVEEYEKAAELLSSLDSQVFAEEIAHFRKMAKEWKE